MKKNYVHFEINEKDIEGMTEAEKRIAVNLFRLNYYDDKFEHISPEKYGWKRQSVKSKGPCLASCKLLNQEETKSVTLFICSKNLVPDFENYYPEWELRDEAGTTLKTFELEDMDGLVDAVKSILDH